VKKIAPTLFSISALGCASGLSPLNDANTPCAAANSFREHLVSVCNAKNEPMPQRISLLDLESHLEGKRVVAFGESHFAVNQSFEKRPYQEYPYDDIMFAEAIPILKSAGFTHIGVELPDFLQPLIDKYHEDKDREALEKAISERYDFYHSVFIPISAAEKHGMRVVCIDHKRENLNYASDDSWNKRENEIYKNVQKILSSRTARLAIFIGATHIRYPASAELGNNFAWITPPLGRMLRDQYGDGYYSVDLFDCNSPYTDACIESKKDLRLGIK
jgi:hypothetical protein